MDIENILGLIALFVIIAGLFIILLYCIQKEDVSRKKRDKLYQTIIDYLNHLKEDDKGE